MEEKLADKICAEWQVIKAAPIGIACCFFLALLVALGAMNIIYGERIEGFKEEEVRKAGLITEYKEKLQGASPAEAAKRIKDLEEQLEPIINPKVREIKREGKSNEDGTYSVFIPLEVYTKPLPPKIRIIAVSEGLLSLSVVNGNFSSRRGNDKDGRPVMLVEYDVPYGGAFVIEVKTKKATDQFEIQYEF